MIWKILTLFYLALIVAVPTALYKSKRRFMTKFYLRMLESENARKLYTQVLLILLLLFHYVYANGNSGELGIVLSTIACAIMYSFRRADKWLRRLRDVRKTFVYAALLAVAIAAVPHLFTLGVTLGYFLLAALFYPSSRALSEWADENTRPGWREHPESLSDFYH